MTHFILDNIFNEQSRFRVFVDGVYGDGSFANLSEAIHAIEEGRWRAANFQIRDVKLRRIVWMRPSACESECVDRFCVRRNGSYEGVFFHTLAGAIAAIPRGDIFSIYEIFEGDARLFTFGLGVDPQTFSDGLDHPDAGRH